MTHRKHKGNSCVLASNNDVPTFGLIDAIWSIAVAGKVRTRFVIFPFACVLEPDVQRDFITARSGLNSTLVYDQAMVEAAFVVEEHHLLCHAVS